MIEIKTIYPYIDDSGRENCRLAKLYAEDEKGVRYKIQNENTLSISEEVVTFYPLKYSFVATAYRCEKQPNDQKKKRKHEEVSRETNVEEEAKVDEINSIEEAELTEPIEVQNLENIEENNNQESEDE